MLLALALALAPPNPASASGTSGTYDRLHAAKAEASSYLKSNWNKYEENYHPSYVLDDDPKTAWVEGADGDGAGQWLTLPLSKLKDASSVKLVIANGYQKSKNLLEANAAPKKVTVIVLGPTGESGRVSAVLERKMGTQEIVVPVQGGVESVKLVVDDVHPGRVYQDLCISDVQVFVDSTVPYNAKAEQAKRDVVRAWKKERVDTAKYFARLPKEFAWATTHFRDSYDTKGRVPFADDKGTLKPSFAKGLDYLLQANDPVLAPLAPEDRAELVRLVELRKPRAASVPAALVRRVEPAPGPRPKLPDGVWFRDAIDMYLSLNDLVLTEPAQYGKARKTAISHPAAMGDIGSVTTGDVEVTKRSDGTIERLYVPITTVISERTTTTSRSHWLFAYDAQGRLTTAATVYLEEEVHGVMIENAKPEDFTTTTVPVESFEVVRLFRDKAGKIDLMTTMRGGVACGFEDEVGAYHEGCFYDVGERTTFPPKVTP